MRTRAKSLALLLVLLLALSGCKGSDVPEKVQVEEHAYTLFDGAEVSVWRYAEDRIPAEENGSEEETALHVALDSKRIYQLEDGTELLATRFLGPEPAEEVSLEVLEPEVRACILGFAQAQRPLYDLEAYLEQAYAEQRRAPKEFRGYLLTQESHITAVDDTTVTVTVAVTLPLGNGEYHTDSSVYSFARNTGTLVEEP